MIARRLAFALALLALAPAPWAQSLPPSLRNCAAESDTERRHACYDREVTRILEAEKDASREQARTAAQAAPPPAATAPKPVAASRAAAAPRRVTAAAQDPARKPSNGTRPTGAHAGDRLSARIESVEATPDELVLHLDNGEVWQQVDRTSGGLGLRAGDSVTIERHLGSYWLSARHVSGMRVRKKSD